MTSDEKRVEILKVWENVIKGSPYVLPEWSKHPKSFISWSLPKYKAGYVLKLKNKKFPKQGKPFNLVWGPPTPGRQKKML